jgi:hypothetical protein
MKIEEQGIRVMFGGKERLSSRERNTQQSRSGS